jgi:hypothetical protein
MFVEAKTCHVRRISYQTFFIQDTGRENPRKGVSILGISSTNSPETSKIFKCSLLDPRRQQGKAILHFYLHEISHKQGGLNVTLLYINTIGPFMGILQVF